MRYAVPITTEGKFLRTLALTAAICATLAGCGGKEPTATSQQAASAAAGSSDQAAAPAEVIPTLPPSNAKWTPEELENLLAPVALYPDIVLAQVLVASTNPQEVLDAGNWLLENTSLENEDLDAAAQQAGFTPPIRALVRSRILK